MMRDERERRARAVALRVAVGLCLLATGCGLCERVEGNKDAATSAASFAVTIPADADLAIFAGDLKAVRDGLGAAERGLGAQFPVKAGMAELERAVGVDVTDLEALRSKGVQPERGLAVARIEEQTSVLLAVEDEGLFTKHLTQTAQQRWSGAAQPIARTVANKPVQMLLTQAASQQQPPMLTADNVIFAWSVVDGVAILVPGQQLAGNTKDPEIVLGKLLATTEATSLAKQADYTKLTETIGSAYPVYGVYNFAGSLERQAKRTTDAREAEALRKTAGRFGRVGVGLQVNDERAQLRALALAQPETLKQISETLKATGDFKLKGALTADSPLVVKLAFDPNRILDEFLKTMEPNERASVEEVLAGIKETRGVDVKGVVLPALDGNVAIVVRDISQKGLSQLVMRGVSAQLLQEMDGVFAFGVRDRAAITKALDQAKDASLGLMSRTEEGGVLTYAIRPPGADEGSTPLLTFVVGDTQLVMLTSLVDPKVGMELARLESQSMPDPLQLKPADKLLTERTWSGLTVDVRRFEEKVAANPAMGRLTTVLAPFQAWMLTVHPEASGIEIELNLLFKPSSRTP